MRKRFPNDMPGCTRRSFNRGMLGLASLSAAPITSVLAGSEMSRKLASQPSPSQPSQYDWNWTRSRPQSAHGRAGMIASTRGGKPMEDASEILRQGGNAMDAALSMAMAQVVYAAGSWVSMAGLFTMAYFDARSGKVQSMNAGYNTVREETDPLSIPMSAMLDATQPENVTSGRAVLVPGFFAGVQAAHERFGSLPFAKLFDSSLSIAEQGVHVAWDFADYLGKYQQHLSRLPETRAIFTKPDGSFYKEGDSFVQPALAGTLRKIAVRGADYIYRGDWARKFVAGVREDGGKMTLRDLQDYRVEWADPIHVRYRGHDVYAHHQAHSMLGMLGLAEAGDLASMGRYYESAEAFYWFHKIFRATGTNMQMMGERINQLAVPAEDWLDADKVARYWKQIRSGSFPDGARSGRPYHSDAIVVVDRWNNVVVLTHSTNTGSTGRFVDGISIPGPAANQQPNILKAGPGRKLPNFIPNTIVLKDGKPAIALSSTGMALHQETVKVLTNIIDYGASGRAAVEAPSFVEPDFKAAGAAPAETVVAGDYAPELLAAVRAKGMMIDEVPFALGVRTVASAPSRVPGVGNVAAIVIDPASGEREAVSARWKGGAMAS